MVEATAKGASSPGDGRAEERTGVGGRVGVERAVVSERRRGHGGVLVDGETDGAGAGGHDVGDAVDDDEGRGLCVGGGGVDAVCVEEGERVGDPDGGVGYISVAGARAPRPCESQSKPLLRSPVRSPPRDSRRPLLGSPPDPSASSPSKAYAPRPRTCTAPRCSSILSKHIEHNSPFWAAR